MSLIEALNWRYATKKMNGKAVPQEKVDLILEAARLAPTSSGLQPFKVIVITNPDLKQTLLPHSFNQSQIIDSSHLLVFAAWDTYTEDRINGVFSHTHNERGTPPESTTDYQKMLINSYVPRSEDVNFNHAARQAYIGFGMALAEAAIQKVDATPMEGFNNAEYDKILGLKEKGLKSVAIMPLGYRDETGDWLAGLKKVRQPKSEFIIEFK
ncbi:NAD(P)H-dependent oxidoreductase [Pedobacter boryungensis]|uniref:NAD(P)H-dependent oxidoreductase n=1 Tax=Pedobacter boryungensis TaxID=869962 RepID=A0ABX2DEY9_9SPHI|nr:NAD(P)H-dependent oxidoreductase [Pedobacter boryungensis]NQX32607.1 NAD(P)H-dependent oxidoreductase [Pedobacter boryungensis]